MIYGVYTGEDDNTPDECPYCEGIEIQGYTDGSWVCRTCGLKSEDAPYLGQDDREPGWDEK